MNCLHKFVDGFGGMGDALVCCKCGLDKYPEALLVPTLQPVVDMRHRQYKAYVRLAKMARNRRRNQGAQA